MCEDVPSLPRFEEEVMSMARELEVKDKEYENCVMALTAVMEMAKVNHHIPLLGIL